MILRRLLTFAALFLLAALASADTKKEVSIWVSRNVAPSAKIRMNINTRNVPSVHIAAYRIDGAKWLRRIGDEQPRPGFSGRPVKEWDQSMVQPSDRANKNQADRYFSRQVNLPMLNPGVYLISVTGAPKEAWAVVNVTHLAVVAKRSPRRMLVWVTDAIKGNVLSGAEVVAYRSDGTRVASGRTGADGAVLMPIKPGGETLVVSRGADMAGVPTSAEDPDGQLKAHFQTDRPIYRPGQQVFFKAILRRTLGQGYRVVPNEKVTIEVRDPKDNPIERIELTSNAMGSVSGEFDIPSEGMVGPHTLVLTAGAQTAYQTFTVAEYRKPEYKVTVRPLQKRWLAGQDITFEVSAEYYFGAPVQQAAIHYSVRRSPIGFWGSDPNDRYFYGGDGNLYARDTYGGNPFVAEDTAHTDKDGKAIITVHTDKSLGDHLYSISCTVEDSSRRQVQGGSSVPVYAAAIRLGLRTKLIYASVGSLIPLEVRATDLDGKPAQAKVTLILTNQIWSEKDGRYKEKELTRTSVSVPATGMANATVPAAAEGSLTVTAIADDGTGRKAKASMEVYVVGPDEKSLKEEESPRVGVMLDRRAY
jgi:alpha-2-macroglobulin